MDKYDDNDDKRKIRKRNDKKRARKNKTSCASLSEFEATGKNKVADPD